MVNRIALRRKNLQQHHHHHHHQHYQPPPHHHHRHYLGSCFSCSFSLSSHRSHQLGWHSHVLHLISSFGSSSYVIIIIMINEDYDNNDDNHEDPTSTLSTITPQGAVATSKTAFISLAIDSRWERISPRFNVPRTFLVFGFLDY